MPLWPPSSGLFRSQQQSFRPFIIFCWLLATPLYYYYLLNNTTSSKSIKTMSDLPRNPDFVKNNVILTEGCLSPISKSKSKKSNDVMKYLSPTKRGGSSSSPPTLMSPSKKKTHLIPNTPNLDDEPAPLSPSKKVNSLNPVTTDDDLIKLLEDRLPNIRSYGSFIRWRTKFLAIYESYLSDDGGIAQASQAYKQFSKTVSKFGHTVVTVQQYVDDKAITSDGASVKGRNAINELNKITTLAVQELQKFVPSTRSEEKQCQYTKFQLGAVLIRDGFTIYNLMSLCLRHSKRMRDGCLSTTADKQVLEMIDYYILNFDRFCDIMSDLGLYEVMMKCHEYAGMKGSGDIEQDKIVFVDLKTGMIGELYRDDLFEHGLFTTNKSNDNSTDNEYGLINEAARGKEAEDLAKLVMEHLSEEY